MTSLVKALYDMIDYFTTLVEKMNDLITCFQEILQKQVVNKTNFNTVLGGPNIYTEEHGHPMLRKDIWILQ